MKRIVRHWKTSEIKFFRENINLMTYSEIAKQLKRTTSSIQSYAYSILKIRKDKSPKYGNQWTAEEDNLLNQHAGSKSIQDMTVLIDRSQLAIKRRMSKFGIKAKHKERSHTWG